MWILQILPVISLVSAAFHGSELFTPKESCKKGDPEIQEAFKPNSLQSITIHPQTCTESTDTSSRVQVIHPQPGFGDPFQVLCDQKYDGGGWTVIQNRFTGTATFYQDWKTYEEGFGNLNGEFWLGLRKIHELTNAKEHELVVLLEAWDGDTASAKYSRFSIEGPVAKYKIIRLGNYTGNAGDSLRIHHNRKFSTFDSDNDDWIQGNCAVTFRSGWWFKDCLHCDLNGWYWKGEISKTEGVYWQKFREGTLRRSRMMIRAVC